jgi:phenylpropionate dioxygenase-like ring-hydroxylating dioxygenase large terminal subunit
MTGHASRFPFPAFPVGWFRVADAADLPPGAVRPLKVLGQDLVLTRGDDGVARAFDAHCPHLGAHLGVGGRMVDGALQCPFHGWRFDAGGDCVGAAGGRRTPAARLRAWPTREWCGAILVHHDPEAARPTWELPAMPETESPDWTPFRPANRWVIRSHPQEFGENGMDIVHFPFLHSQQTAEIRSDELRAEGPLLFHRTFQRYAIFGLARLWAPEVKGPLDITLVGPGCAVNRARVQAGIELEYTYLFFFTPLDGEHVEMRSLLSMRRVGSRLLEWVLLRKAMSEGARTIEQDIPIWENKRYRERPLLSEADGPILAFRRWYRQFDRSGRVREPAGSAHAEPLDSRETAAGTSADEREREVRGYRR